jgi:hypothetical protein
MKNFDEPLFSKLIAEYKEILSQSKWLNFFLSKC